MKRLLVTFILLSSGLDASEPYSIADLLPESGAVVDIMKTIVPERCDSLMTVWRRALSADPEWSKNYVKSHSDLEPGDILPYSPRFIITEAEYYEMIDCISSPSFDKVAEDEFEIVKEGTVYRIESTIHIRDFINLRIDEENMVLKGYFGSISECDTVISNDTAIGLWTGYIWHEQTGNEQDGRLITFVLGHFDGTSRGLMTFKLRIIENGIPTAACDWKVFFESGISE